MKNKLMSDIAKRVETPKFKKSLAGEIPAGWSSVLLGEVLETIESGMRPKGGVNAESGDIPSFGGENIKSDGGVVYAGVNRVPLPFYQSMPKGILKDKDVLINKDGAWTGKVGLYNASVYPEACINEHLFILRGNPKYLTQEFLYYLLLSDDGQAKLGRVISGSAQPGLGASFPRFYNVQVPTIKEQKAIVDVLCSIDDVIARTQDLVFQMRVTNTGLIGSLLTRGLPGQHRKYKVVEIGEIPFEWRCVRLKELLTEPIRNGYSPNCPQVMSGKWMLTLGAVTHNGFNPVGKKPAPPDDMRCDENLLKKGDLLVSRSNVRNRVGLAGVYEGNPENCSYPDLLMRVRLQESKVLVYWLEKWLLSGKGRAYMEREARGTSGSMVKIDRRILENLMIPLPPISEQREILKSILCLNAAESINLRYLSELKKIKTVLMKELLTGKVRV